ncbi:DUF2470 domain-containing protein [Klenkia sp. LSe6-5]|uniref:DUF2470 domain-containing protein n=1 Tax=Klenkia sesuvii TaxID=3103137 RepID=A0ABU8DR45_9ACTN
MTSTTPSALRPTAAERARTVACRPSAAVCAAGVSGSRVLAHATTGAGQVFLVVPADGELVRAVQGAADGDLPALVMVTDHAPVPLRDQVRAQLWLSGWLTPVRTEDERDVALAFAEAQPAGALLDVGRTAVLLRLDLAEVVLGEGGTTVELTPEDYADAEPDPLVAVEASALRHLDADHPGELALLRSRIPADWLGAHDVVRPLGLDRAGFRLRIEGERGYRDVRVPFDAPVTSEAELGPAVHRLMCAARRCCRGQG